MSTFGITTIGDTDQTPFQEIWNCLATLKE